MSDEYEYAADAATEVESFERLRQLAPTAEGEKIKLRSWHTDKDLGGGEFVGHLGNASDDGGIIAAGNGYYWKRILENEVHANMFGALPASVDSQYDSAPAFRAAVAAVKIHNRSKLYYEGNYNLKSVGPTVYELPYDDGTVSPNFKAKGEVDIDPEEIHTMPIVLDIPSYVVLEGLGNISSALIFTWRRGEGPIDTQQAIGICWRVAGYPAKDRMTDMVRGVGLVNTSISSAFIGCLADGVLFYRINFRDLIFNNCGLPFIAQGSDAVTFAGSTSLESCMAGIIIGGMWLTRNDTWVGGKWVPPYADDTDVYAMGWCDYTTFEFLSGSYPSPGYTPRHKVLDEFFNTYFYKSANSESVAKGGRLTATDFQGIVSDYNGKDPYRGVAGRFFINFSRYKRGNCNVQIKDMKVYGPPRVPVYTPRIQGQDYYGTIENAYIERVGFIEHTKPWSDANDFYKSLDTFNPDYKTCPNLVAEGVIGARKVTLQGTPYRPTSQGMAHSNTRQHFNIWTDDLEKWKENTSSSAVINDCLVYDNNGKGWWVWRNFMDRVFTRPLIFNEDDVGKLEKAFKWRVDQLVLSLKSAGATVASINANAQWFSGLGYISVEIPIPDNAASDNGMLSVTWLPKIDPDSPTGIKGTTSMVSGYSIVTTENIDVKNGAGTVVGSFSQKKEVKGVTMNNQQLYLHSDRECSDAARLKMSDFKPGSSITVQICFPAKFNWY
ncbi:hypothetical protein ACLPIA_01105 [Serratia nematodiphila]|uniref:hypothetical protein n=1 Tax=Serratia marcescens TaxID=615 RepID=UPI003879CDED